MPSFEELDQLSSKELHDRALRLARHRLDVHWLWQLMEAVPEAQAATGNMDRANADMQHVFNLWDDLAESGEGKLADALRPMYIDYLGKHEK